ncbi:hypothetical protein [Vreelandella profundi]|uniref:hypothetical protein n=1 Tax=Vreelandella profundi TaxID=2852117 RepID=UPI001F1EB922|nr:hypothetical protein [Halomonas profundi]
MSNESLEVQFARLDERNKMILSRLEQGQKDQELSRQEREKLFDIVQDISHRLKNLEGSFSSAQPTIDEFRAIKLKVTGAGLLDVDLSAAENAGYRRAIERLLMTKYGIS